MKNIYMTVITIITVCCVVCGTLYHVGGFWAELPFFGSRKTADMGVDLEEFNSIDFDMDWASVSVVAGDKFALSCEYTEGMEPVYKVENNGTLSIRQKQKRATRWFGMGGEQCSVTLTVPEKTALDNVKIETAFGDIEIDGITASKCEAQADMGKCVVKNSSFDKTDAYTNMGDVSLDDSALGMAEAGSDMGEIKVRDCTFSGLDAETSMGGVTVSTAQELDGYEMALETSMGDVSVNGDDEGTKYKQKGKDGSIKLTSDMGSVRLDYGTGVKDKK